MTDTFPPGRPFTCADLPDLGVTIDQLRGHLAHGVVKQLFHGVYVPVDWVDTPANRARAARLVLPPHCVVVDRSAAGLHGIDVLDPTEVDVPPDLEVASIGGANPTRRRGILGGKRDLRPDDIMAIDGVAVTTPLRTACDVACLRGRWRAIAVLDAFRAHHGLTTSQLTGMVRRFGGRRGVTQLRELVPLSRDGVDSQPESWIRLEIHDNGYPMPEAQVWSWVPGWGRVKVENAYRHLRIAVEYDGEEFHSEDADRDHDEARRTALGQVGWIIIVVRRDGLTVQGREGWLAELRKAYDDRAPVTTRPRRYARSPEARLRRRGR